MEAPARLNAHFSGTVQGVGFRATTRNLASRLPVTGYVKNLPDGSVELVAEGERNDLETLLRDVRSQMGSLIQDVRMEWGSTQGAFQDFSVRF